MNGLSILRLFGVILIISTLNVSCFDHLAENSENHYERPDDIEESLEDRFFSAWFLSDVHLNEGSNLKFLKSASTKGETKDFESYFVDVENLSEVSLVEPHVYSGDSRNSIQFSERTPAQNIPPYSEEAFVIVNKEAAESKLPEDFVLSWKILGPKIPYNSSGTLLISWSSDQCSDITPRLFLADNSHHKDPTGTGELSNNNPEVINRDGGQEGKDDFGKIWDHVMLRVSIKETSCPDVELRIQIVEPWQNKMAAPAPLALSEDPPQTEDGQTQGLVIGGILLSIAVVILLLVGIIGFRSMRKKVNARKKSSKAYRASTDRQVSVRLMGRRFDRLHTVSLQNSSDEEE